MNVYKISDLVVFDIVDEEIVLLQMKSGRFLHFNKATKSLLEYFKQPGTLEGYLQVARAPEGAKEVVEKVLNLLLSENILVIAEAPSARPPDNLEVTFSPPFFLREGKKQYKDLVHLAPVPTGH